MNFITSFLSDEITYALGWALVHSLWQGALVSLILGVLLILLNRHTAQVRYRVSYAALFVVLLLFSITFIRLYSTAESSIVASSSAVEFSTATAVAAVQEVATAPLWERAYTWGETYFAQHLPLYVLLWLMGLVLMGLRLLGGLAYLKRLRNYRSERLGSQWQATLAQVQERMGMHKAVQLAESALVQVPMAMGYLKPIILLPVGAVTGLSQRQLEAVLAHELAHLMRHDYVLNLLQQLVETVFFFHPAVWWMSGVVRAEREHCCDDLAVAACGDTVTYARALAQLQEMNLAAAPKYAMALTGHRGSLLSRIKRLLSAQELRPSFEEGFVAALVVVVGLVLLSFGAWAGVQQQDTPSSLLPNADSAENTAEFTLPLPEEDKLLATTLSIIDTTGQNADLIIIKNKKGDIAELYVNGRKIPKKDIPAFQQLIDEHLQAAARAPRMKAAEKEAALDAARSSLSQTQNERETYSYSYRYSSDGDDNLAVPPLPPMRSVAAVPPVPPVPPAPVDGLSKTEKQQQTERYEQEMKRYEQELAKFHAKMEKEEAYYQDELKRITQQDNYRRYTEAEIAKMGEAEKKRYQEVVRRQAEAEKRHAESMKRHEESLKRHEESVKRHEESMRRHDESVRRHEETTAFMNNLQEELVKDGLVQKDAKEVDFKIDEKGLFINGNKQSDALYNKYRNLVKTEDGKPRNITLKKNATHQNLIIND